MDLNKLSLPVKTDTNDDDHQRKVHEQKAPTTIVSSDNSFKFNFSIESE